MEHSVRDDLERRLRASRPVIDDAYDAALLERVRALPIERRRLAPRAAPVAVAAAAIAAAIVVLTGAPGGPSSASAVTQAALRWFAPPPGTILHVRSVETQDGVTTTRELWESADHPAMARERRHGAGQTVESAGASYYDAATNTIHESAAPSKPAKPGDAAKAGKPAPGKVDPLAGLPAADPIVDKTRSLLQAGDMEVAGHATIDGQDAWAISLKADAGRPVWTLYVAASDGRPLELRDPGRDTSEAPQTIRWPVYEVLSDVPDPNALLTLHGAHPDARVVAGDAPPPDKG
jgi:hypothetical protein